MLARWTAPNSSEVQQYNARAAGVPNLGQLHLLACLVGFYCGIDAGFKMFALSLAFEGVGGPTAPVARSTWLWIKSAPAARYLATWTPAPTVCPSPCWYDFEMRFLLSRMAGKLT